MKTRRPFLLGTFLFFVFQIYANEFLFSHININNDLSQASATSIYQDGLGQIWFGNKYLNVYADNTLRTLCLSEYLPGTKDNNIHSICGDGNELLYMLANDKLVCYDIRLEKFSDTDIHTQTICFGQKALHFAVNGKIFKYTEGAQPKEIYSLPDTLGKITALLFNENDLWAGTNRGVYRYAGNTLSCILPHADISCLFFDSKQNLWIGTYADGVKRYNLQTGLCTEFKQNDPAFSLINNQVRCINEDRQSNIWVGTYKGLFIISGTTDKTNHITSNNSISPWSLSHSSVYAIYRDKQEGMWVGTYYGGLDYFNPDTEQYTYYPSNNSDLSALHGFIFGNMTEDKQANIYIGTENGGVNILNRQTRQIRHLEVPASIDRFHTIKSVWFDQENERLFIGTFKKGLAVYTPATKQFKQIQSELMNEKEYQIILQIKPWKNYILILTQGGIFRLDRQTLEVSAFPGQTEMMPNNYMRTMHISAANQIWVASSTQSVYSIDPESLKISYPEQLKKAIGQTTIYSICEDDKGRLYFVADRKGIIRYNPANNEIVHYSKETCELPTDQYYQTAILPSRKLLATFNNGITLLNPETKEADHTLLNKTTPLASLNENCGLYVSPQTDELFIGGVKGLISLKEDDLHGEKKPYNLWFSKLSINNVPVSEATSTPILTENIAFTRTLQVAHNQNNLSFEFSTSNYSSGNSLFRYKLEGLDKEWTTAKHQTFTYTALSPGTYRLVVQEADDSEKQIEMQINVRPPFYASLPAMLFYFLLFVLLLVWLIRFNRSRAALKVSLEMEHREKKRIEELNQIKLQFFTNISHEIRTPITLISSLLEMVLMNTPLALPLRKKLNKIYKHTLYVQELITEILDFRRQEQKELTLHISRKDITMFLKEVFNTFAEYAENRKITYTFEASKEELLLWFDPVQLKKVFINLLSNAFKNTPSGGKITLFVHKSLQGIEIIVSDTGYGIPENEQAFIFDRFYQVDSKQYGTGSGIGLALTRSIILQHKGLITVSSIVNTQTQFKVILPEGDLHFTEEQKKSRNAEILPTTSLSLLLDDTANVEIEEKNKEEELQLKKYSILLVEDNIDLLSLLEEAFTPIYQIYKATNGEMGVQIACEVIPDLIVSDVMMPNLSGYELCHQLKNKIETSHIPILLLTAKVSPEQEFEGLSCGADSYITKPFNLELLLLKCNNCIKNRQKLQAYFLSSQPIEGTVELATNRMDQKLLDQSIQLIQDNLQDNEFNIDKWCSEVGISRSKLYNKIKAITGLTLNDFILQIKLDKSANLLTNRPELSISEISWQCGFTTSGYFGKCFKNRYHVTPKEYRSNNCTNSTSCAPQ